MKRNKILAAALALVLVLALSVGTTLAYFTSQDQVVNTFSTKDKDPANPDGQTPVDIEIEEPGWTPTEDGKMTNDDAKNIYPGQSIDKAPVVNNVGAYDAYIRASVENADAATLTINGLTDNTVDSLDSLNAYAAANPNQWVEYNGYYYYTSIVAPGNATSALFQSVTVSVNLTAFIESIDITVNSDAVQADGFATIGAAFAAAYSVA